MSETYDTYSYEGKIRLYDETVALKPSPRIPIAPMMGNLPLWLSSNGATFKDVMYNPAKAADATIEFYSWFRPDAGGGLLFHSGQSNEIAQTQMFDWPGQPGKTVPDFTTYQCHEIEFMFADEYDELLDDMSAFMLKKFIPRAFPGLAGLGSINLRIADGMGTGPLGSLMLPPVLEAYDKLKEMASYEAAQNVEGARINAAMAEFGIPPLVTGIGLAPFDVISDTFRGTEGAWMDLLEQPDKVQAACEMFADIQIANWQYFRFAPLPVKRVFWPLHKAMDGLMSPEHFDKIYWQPMLRCINALADMGVTSIIYSEGFYNTRINAMVGLPVGKTVIHMEYADPAVCKKAFDGVACLSGFIPILNLEWGTKEKVIDETKRFLDVLATGSGYIFDTTAGIEKAKRENFEAMIETVRDWS
jgi:uroporphyrinogen-III decarboxylase